MFYMEDFMNRLYGLVIMSLLATLSTFAMDKKRKRSNATEQSSPKKPRIELEANDILNDQELRLFMQDIESGELQKMFQEQHDNLAKNPRLAPQQTLNMFNAKDILELLTNTTFGLKKEKK
jgi:hypothetical protein